jgi:hypothetical protein
MREKKLIKALLYFHRNAPHKKLFLMKLNIIKRVYHKNHSFNAVSGFGSIKEHIIFYSFFLFTMTYT